MEMSLRIPLLRLLEENARLQPETLATMLEVEQKEVEQALRELEQEKVILKYTATINWDKTEETWVTAMIDVKVAPKKEVGFDEVAERIYRYPEVQSVYLMSGAYDLSVVVSGKSLQEVAQFVSEKLSSLDSVLSTTTHFILKKYKHDKVIFTDRESDKRMVVSP